MKIIDKIFRDKKQNPVIYIVLAVGILMLVLSGNSSPEDNAVREKLTDSEYSSLRTETEGILSDIAGVGEVSVMISTNKEKKDNVEMVESVLVVADGGSNAEVKEQIIRAVKAALGVETHKIEVFERKEEQ